MAIRWRDKDLKLLKKSVAAYNRKIRSEIKKYPEKEAIYPPIKSYKDLRLSITSRQQFNNTINSLNRIKKKGALDEARDPAGSIITKYQLNEDKLLVRAQKDIVRNRLKKANLTGDENKQFLRSLGLTVNSFDDIEKNINERKKAGQEPEKIAQAYQNFIKKAKTHSAEWYRVKDEMYLNNYINKLKSVFSEDNYNQIVQMINDKGWSGGDLFYLSIKYPSLGLDFIYDFGEFSENEMAEYILTRMEQA